MHSTQCCTINGGVVGLIPSTATCEKVRDLRKILHTTPSQKVTKQANPHLFAEGRAEHAAATGAKDDAADGPHPGVGLLCVAGAAEKGPLRSSVACCATSYSAKRNQGQHEHEATGDRKTSYLKAELFARLFCFRNDKDTPRCIARSIPRVG